MSDDLDVAISTIQTKLRPLYAVVAGGIMVLGAGVVYVYDLATFIVEDSVHERQQDENLVTLKSEIASAKKEAAHCREINVEIVKYIIRDTALMRQVQLELVPKRKRSQLRKDYDQQNEQGIEILVSAQKVP